MSEICISDGFRRVLVLASCLGHFGVQLYTLGVGIQLHLVSQVSISLSLI